MEIKKGDNKFFIGKNEEENKGEITFVDSGDDKIIIDKTFVSEELEGQGIGKKLIDKTVEYARENDLKILATCPYAIEQLEKNEEYHDVYIGK